MYIGLKFSMTSGHTGEVRLEYDILFVSTAIFKA